MYPLRHKWIKRRYLRRNENQVTDLSSVINFVDNPQTIERYPDVYLNDDGFYRIDPDIFFKRYTYIIITDKNLSSSFKTLISHKQSRGISAKLFLLNDIYSNYSGASRTAARTTRPNTEFH